MPTTHTPKYPVVDPEPPLDKAIANFNFRDIVNIAAFTGAGFTYGWFGVRKPFRYSNSRFLAGIGLMSGFFYATLSSTQRFMGLEPNDSEVASYGALTTQQVTARQAKLNHPNLGLIDASAHPDNFKE